MSAALEQRPTSGKLTVPFVVNERNNPIDFKAMDMEHVARCARQHRCGVCGARIKPREKYAFVGPNDERRCFADPWMHERCARLAMQQCPFLGGRDWRDKDSRDNQLIATYRANMVLYVASSGSAHCDSLGNWHFEAQGMMWRPGRSR